MNEAKIQCPECNTEIALTETLAAGLIETERAKHRRVITDLKSAHDQTAQALTDRETKVKQAEQLIQKTLADERDSLSKKIEQDVRKDMQAQLASVEQRMIEKDERLKQSEKLELDSRKRMADADEKARQAELNAQRRLDEERKTIADAAKLREDELKKELAKRDESLASAEKQVTAKVAAEREKVINQTRAEVTEEMNQRLSDSQKQLAMKDQRIKESESLELESRKRMVEAEEKTRQADLEVQRRLDAERKTIREQAQRETSEEAHRKILEKDKVIDQMTKKIVVLHRQADSKSQQLQGEVEEVTILTRLQECFPRDEFERTPKGKNGGDILMKVKTPSGRLAGTVLIEAKDTQSFDNKWIEKLKTDTQNQKVDIGVIVSRTMPSDVKHYVQRNDIWICRVDLLVSLLAALRSEVLHVSRVRGAAELSESTRDVVFHYLTSPDFTRRVTSMVDGYDAIRASLDKQKKQFNRSMSEQERALDKMITGLTGVYGDLSHLAGTALKPVPGLEVDDVAEQKSPAILQVAENDPASDTSVA